MGTHRLLRGDRAEAMKLLPFAKHRMKELIVWMRKHGKKRFTKRIRNANGDEIRLRVTSSEQVIEIIAGAFEYASPAYDVYFSEFTEAKLSKNLQNFDSPRPLNDPGEGGVLTRLTKIADGRTAYLFDQDDEFRIGELTRRGRPAPVTGYAVPSDEPQSYDDLLVRQGATLPIPLAGGDISWKNWHDVFGRRTRYSSDLGATIEFSGSIPSMGEDVGDPRLLLAGIDKDTMLGVFYEQDSVLDSAFICFILSTNRGRTWNRIVLPNIYESTPREGNQISDFEYGGATRLLRAARNFNAFKVGANSIWVRMPVVAWDDLEMEWAGFISNDGGQTFTRTGFIPGMPRTGAGHLLSTAPWFRDPVILPNGTILSVQLNADGSGAQTHVTTDFGVNWEEGGPTPGPGIDGIGFPSLVREPPRGEPRVVYPVFEPETNRYLLYTTDIENPGAEWFLYGVIDNSGTPLPFTAPTVNYLPIYNQVVALRGAVDPAFPEAYLPDEED